jgi:hypothetical protein
MAVHKNRNLYGSLMYKRLIRRIGCEFMVAVPIVPKPSASGDGYDSRFHGL